MSSASSQQSSLGDELKSESVKYILLVDSHARSRRGVNSSKVKMKFKSKHEDQRVLKGSLWEHRESISPNPSITSLGSGGSRISTRNLSLLSHVRKLELDSIEYDEVRLSCPETQVKEISENECRLLLAIPDSLERYKLYSDTERFITCSYVSVNSPVEVNTRCQSSLPCMVRWKGRIPSRQGVWFGLEIEDTDRRGSGDTDGTLNGHRYFPCQPNDGLFVNISSIKAIPPIKPERKSKRSPSVTRKKLANGHVVCHSNLSDSADSNRTNQSTITHTNHVDSHHGHHTDSDVSCTIDDLDSTVPLVPVTEVCVGDRVVWPSSSGYERATVKWMGVLPTDNQEEGEMLVGVEFDNPVGKGTGFYQKKRLFCARKGHASLVPLVGLYKEQTKLAESSSIPTPPPQFCDDMDAHPLNAEEVLKSLAIDDDLSHKSGAETKQASQKRRHNVTVTTNTTSNRKSTNVGRLNNCRLSNQAGSRSDHSATTNSSNESINSPRSMPVTPRKNRPPHSNMTSRSRASNSRPSTLLPSELSVPAVNHRPSSAGSTSPRSCDWSHESDCQSSPTHTSPYHLPSPIIYSQPTSQTKPTSHLSNPKANSSKQTPPKLPAKRNKAPQSPSHVCRCLPNDGKVVEGCPVVVDGETGVVRWIGYEYSKPNRYFAGVKMDKLNTSCTYGWYGEERLVETMSRDILFIGLEKCRLKNDTKTELMSTGFPVLLNTDDEDDDGTLVYPIEKFSRDKIGQWKGIQGENNSCYIDSCLYAMFCFTSTFDHLLSEEIAGGSPNLKQIHNTLRDDIVNPLRRHHLVRATSMRKLRKLLDALGLVKGMTLDEQDPEEFMNLLLSNVFHSPPPLRFSNDVMSHIFHLVGERDARIAFPALQELMEHTCAQQKIKFKSVPRYLIVHMPRFGSEFRLYDKVFPNLKLDLRDVLEGATRSCYVCGKPAETECHECYKVELQWKKSTYCDDCSNTFHKHERRTCHVPLKLKASTRSPTSSPSKHSKTSTCTLDLFALLCIKTSHYVAFCKARDQTTSQWIFFNSMADRKNSQCIPETSIVENMEYWLSPDGFDCIAKDIDGVPSAIKRLLTDTYICFYAQTNRTDNTSY